MLREHDERAKLIAEQTLDLLGEVTREVEVPTSDAQRIDLWLQRRPSGAEEAMPRSLALLAALFCEDAIIEAFSDAVRLTSFFESLRKQYAFRWHLDRRRRLATPEAGAADLPPLRPPLLWVISAGRPAALFTEYELRQRAGFPTGIYDFSAGFRIGLVVLSELPPGVETVLLRMMGTGPVLRAAVAEVKALPPEDPESPRLLRIVTSLRHTLRHATTVSDEERDEFMTAAWAEFEEYERHLLNKGRKEGREEARTDLLRENIRKLCEGTKIDLSAEREGQLRQLDEIGLKRIFDHLVDHHAWP